MKKKMLRLLVLAGALALCVAGYFLLRALTAPAETPETEGGETETGGTYAVCTVDKATVSVIRTTVAGTETLFTLKDDKTGWLWSENPTLPIDNTYIANMVLACTDLTSTVRLTGVDDAALAEYGLDDPSMTLSFTDTQNGTQTFFVGARNSYNALYYFRVASAPTTVYMVDASVLVPFGFSPLDMVKQDTLPTDLTASKLTAVTLTSADGKNQIRYTYYSGGKNADDETDVWYVSLNGAAEVRVDKTLGSAFSSALASLSFSELIGTTPDERTAAGLDQPATLVIDYLVTTSFEDSDTGAVTKVDNAASVTLLIGNDGTDSTLSDGGLVYATVEGSTLSYTLAGTVFAKLLRFDLTGVPA